MTVESQQQEYFGRDLEAMSFAVNYHRWILDEFRAFIGRTVVEVGAGTGNFTSLLLTTRPSLHFALEPAANVFARLAEKFAGVPNVRALRGTLADLSGEVAGGADTVLYVNVLEHIEDDRRELERARATLRPGGHLCVFVPALPWLYGTADAAFGHHRRYTRGGLERLVASAGFRVVRLRHFDLAGILPWFVLFRVLKRPSITAGQAKWYDRLVVPALRRLESAVAPPTGKNLLLVAQRD
ncbi:MAG: class I SAM-dependent methyltransferase [Acidobacteria bacterium]|nr:class I SAM-dependent methyltransferase [Acidobacteriota bacterium]